MWLLIGNCLPNRVLNAVGVSLFQLYRFSVVKLEVNLSYNRKLKHYD